MSKDLGVLEAHQPDGRRPLRHETRPTSSWGSALATTRTAEPSDRDAHARPARPRPGRGVTVGLAEQHREPPHVDGDPEHRRDDGDDRHRPEPGRDDRPDRDDLGDEPDDPRRQPGEDEQGERERPAGDRVASEQTLGMP